MLFYDSKGSIDCCQESWKCRYRMSVIYCVFEEFPQSATWSLINTNRDYWKKRIEQRDEALISISKNSQTTNAIIISKYIQARPNKWRFYLVLVIVRGVNGESVIPSDGCSKPQSTTALKSSGLRMKSRKLDVWIPT